MLSAFYPSGAVRAIFRGALALTDASVERVPEINGSGFAYIAFILGALGLWLYSGAGRGRVEEEPVAA